MTLTGENERRIYTGTAVPETYLDDLREKFRDYLSGERACRWSAGDMIAKALSFMDDLKNTKTARRQLLGSFAEIGHCTTAYCRQLAAVSSSFGTEYRQPDIAWSLYRACVQASRRTGEPAHKILERCKSENLHAGDVAKLGRKDEAFVALSATCGDCSAEVRVRIRGAKSFSGLRVPCPICVATKKTDDGILSAEVLGVLE